MTRSREVRRGGGSGEGVSGEAPSLDAGPRRRFFLLHGLNDDPAGLTAAAAAAAAAAADSNWWLRLGQERPGNLVEVFDVLPLSRHISLHGISQTGMQDHMKRIVNTSRAVFDFTCVASSRRQKLVICP